MVIITPKFIDDVRKDFEIIEGIFCRNGNPVGYFDKSSGYWKIKYKGKNWLVHRLAFLFHHGFLPPMVDHKDRDVNNNTENNLRAATRGENTINSEARSDNTSGFKGVTWHKHVKKWHSSVYTNGKRYYCGVYDDINEAAKAYNIKATELFGEFALLNIIKE